MPVLSRSDRIIEMSKAKQSSMEVLRHTNRECKAPAKLNDYVSSSGLSSRARKRLKYEENLHYKVFQDIVD